MRFFGRSSCRAWLQACLLGTASLAAHAAPIDDLTVAAYRDNGYEIGKLLAAGVDPNAADARGRHAINIALIEQSDRAVKALLAYPRLDANVRNANGETPLMLAALKGRLDWVQMLVARGALINLAEGWTPLHYACSGPDNGVALWLLSQGADINARSPNDSTPLMMAARYGDITTAEQLLKAGAEPRLANEQNLTAADFAQAAGRDGLAKLLNAAMAAANAKARR
ncbi:MAG: ankyrin repeat domain-containing protein [Burkholderiaceae bacterium]